jgi:hypothetical protein
VNFSAMANPIPEPPPVTIAMPPEFLKFIVNCWFFLASPFNPSPKERETGALEYYSNICN